MKYLVSPIHKKSVVYLTTYKPTDGRLMLIQHEEGFRYEQYIVEFQPGVKLNDIEKLDTLELDDQTYIKSYDPDYNDGDIVYSEWEFIGVPDDEVEELEQYLEDHSDLDEHSGWESVDLSIIVTNGVRIEPYQ